MSKMRFSLTCYLLVVVVLCAVEAVPMPNNPDATHDVVTESSNDELQANAVTEEPDLETPELWRTYKQKYNKEYKSPAEEKTRETNFKINLATIRAHNDKYDKGLASFKMGVNQFTDMSLEEYSKKMNGLKQNTLTGARGSTVYTQTSTSIPLPSTVDWRVQGYVTPVKDQGPCASCWAFSVTGVLEGQIYRSTGSLVALSEQNLLDCSSSYGNQGCAGGMAGYTYNYIKANGGVDTNASYPYTAVQSTCRYNAYNVGAKITSYVSLPYGDEQALMQAVATVGPIAVGVDANHQSFQNYLSGIYYESSCKTSVNHAVLIVGYGTSNGNNYWIVKNSWGTGWGDKGYVYMSRNRGNQCGIASYATYPKL